MTRWLALALLSLLALAGCGTEPQDSSTGIGGFATACTLQGDRAYWSESGTWGFVIPHSEAPDCPVLEPTPPATR